MPGHNSMHELKAAQAHDEAALALETRKVVALETIAEKIAIHDTLTAKLDKIVASINGLASRK